MDYVDISRHTRDCDFVIRQSNLEQITEWLGLDIEAFHQRDRPVSRMILA